MIVAAALLVVGACLALVFDRLWLDAAQVELHAAAEAAALAGAGQLATDARLNPKPVDLTTPARDAAIAIGQKNFAVGTPVDLLDGEDGDVQIGTIEMSPDTGETQFVVNTERPTTCVVRVARLRSRGNPVALLIRSMTGKSTSDAQAFAEASVDNRILGVQPNANSPVPALPLAILHTHPDPRRLDTWQRQIEMRMGRDRFGFDAATGAVTAGPDGIPEIVLHTASPSASQDDAAKVNVLTIDIGTGLHESQVAQQFQTGWTVDHLQTFGDEFRTDQGPYMLDADASLVESATDPLQQFIGQTRICGLYADHQPTSRTLGRASINNLVGIRLLAIDDAGGQTLHITVQPAVIATRTALLVTHDAAWMSGDNSEPTNPYIYKLFLSH
jgi:hypothetical protein